MTDLYPFPQSDFWDRVDKSSGIEGCWPWTLAKSCGYGQFGRKVGGKLKNFRTHRLALEYKLQRHLLPGECACHKCDNPECCNPNHLFVGTQTENMADMNSKGRNAWHRPRKTTGEAHGMAKLTAGQVDAIRRDHRVLREVARDYNVSIQQIWRIRHRKGWRVAE